MQDIIENTIGETYEKKSISNYNENDVLMEKTNQVYSNKEILTGSLKSFFTRILIQKNTDLQLFWNDLQYGIKWRQDMEEVEETEAKINISHIPLKEMIAAPKVSARFLNSSNLNVRQFIYERVMNRFTEEENRCFLFGNGEREISGILHANNIDKIKKISLKDKKNIIEALLDMEHSLPNSYRSNSHWIMSRNLLLELEAYAYNKENNFNLLKDGLNYTLFGRNIFIFEHDKKTPFLCILIHQSAYVVIEKSQIDVIENPYICTPDTQFMFIKHMGAGLVNTNALVLLINN